MSLPPLPLPELEPPLPLPEEEPPLPLPELEPPLPLPEEEPPLPFPEEEPPLPLPEPEPFEPPFPEEEPPLPLPELEPPLEPPYIVPRMKMQDIKAPVVSWMGGNKLLTKLGKTKYVAFTHLARAGATLGATLALAGATKLTAPEDGIFLHLFWVVTVCDHDQ